MRCFSAARSRVPPRGSDWCGARGLWRSLVAHLTGGQGVAGSNPVSPTATNNIHRGWSGTCFFFRSLVIVGSCRRDLAPIQLSSVLRELRFESASYRRLDLCAPWRLRFDGGLRGVHIVVQGRCSITVDGKPPQNVETGDLVVLPRADSHQMSSMGDEHGPAESALNLAKRTSGPQLNAGGAGPTTTILCGAFFFGDDGHPAVAGLPSFIHVPGQRGRSPSWLTGLTGALAAETVDGGPGSEVVMARLSDALITRALRHHVETGEERGWLRGLSDPYVATV